MASRDQLRVLPFGAHTPSYNMALDSHLLELCERDPSCGYLRFYQWSPPALSLGFFEAADSVDRDRAARRGIEVVSRPTGGRVVLHKGDLTYCVVTARRGGSGAELYARVSECIVAGLRSLGADVEIARGVGGGSVGTRGSARPCFLSASRHEIVYRGRKVAGSAQRLGRNAVLQHGSIPIDGGYLAVVEYLKCSEERRADLRRGMLAATACVGEIVGSPIEPAVVAAALLGAFRARFGASLAPARQDPRSGVERSGCARLTP